MEELTTIGEQVKVILEDIRRASVLQAKNVLDMDDLALYLGKSKRTLYNIVDSIPHYKSPTGVLMFRKDEIDDWLCAVRCQVIEFR